MKKKLSKILAAILCVCTLTACGSGGQEAAPEEESAAKDTLTIATQADMGDKDPINGITTNDTIKIKAQVYETLIERTVPEQEYKPLLAESWEFNDDATELTITLREGITTHNGETLTSEDCLFSLGLLRESANKSVTDHMDLENSYAVDDRTFVIVMDEPYMPVIANLSYPTCVMVSKKGYEEGNGDWANMDIGTGPYTWGEWSIGSSVKLTGFDNYYVEGQPAIKNVEFKVISEDGNRYIEVETGGADLCYNLSGVDIEGEMVSTVNSNTSHRYPTASEKKRVKRRTASTLRPLSGISRSKSSASPSPTAANSTPERECSTISHCGKQS